MTISAFYLARLLRLRRQLILSVGVTILLATSAVRAADAPTAGSLYLENCALCHGEDGRGPTNPDYAGPMLVENAFIRSHSEVELVAFLKRGRQPDAPDSQMHILMPPFDSLPEAELKILVQFIRQMNAIR